MPKFGNVRYTRIGNTMEDYEKKVTIIRTKIRDHTSEKGTIGKPCKRITQEIIDLLKLHPSGPFTGSIIGNWDYKSSFNSMDSSDRNKKFLYFVTFTHPDDQTYMDDR